MLSWSSFERGTLIAAATSAAMIAEQVAGKAARDALYLSSFDASSLPYMMATSALLSLPVILWLSRLLAHHSPVKVLPILLGLSTAVLALAWTIGYFSPPIAAIIVYFHSTLFGPAVLTSFWSLINERFDPHNAKRAVAQIAAGGTLGGVFGALAVWGMSTVLEPRAVLMLLAGLHAACVIGAISIRTPALHVEAGETSAAAPAKAISPLRVLKEVPFIRNMALLVGLGAVISAVLDYTFGAQASATIAKGPALLSFFALFGLAVSVVSFLIQVSLGSKVLEKLGLAWNIALLPLALIGGGAFALLAPGLTSGAVLRGTEMVQRNTLFRSAYELLYTPISEQRKRATKALIDIGCDRFGTILGSAVVFAVLRLSSDASTVLIAGVIFFALLVLPLARQLHRGYVATLEEGMRDRAKQLDLPETIAPLRQSEEQSDVFRRDEMLERAEKKRATPQPCVELLEQPQMILEISRDLLSGDVKAARRALKKWSPAQSSCTPFAIMLLAHKELHRDALNALRKSAPCTSGQLIDALLDRGMDFVVRRRIPRVLSVCDTQRAIDGLLLGIADERFEVRYECGLALLRISARNPRMEIERELIIDAIHREVAAQANPKSPPRELDEDEEPSVLLDLLARDRCDRTLEHIFTLLCLILEREPLCSAFQALHHDDTRHRGTALEYLATVLPVEVRDEIWPLLGGTSPLPTVPPIKEALADLH